MGITAVVFDLDGLICDTESADLRAWQEVFEGHGGRLASEEWNGLAGRVSSISLYDVLERQVGPVDRAAVRMEREARLVALADATPLCDGVTAWLEEARDLGLLMGLASNSPRRWVDRHLRRLGIADYFRSTASRDDVEHPKPAPDLYLRVLDELGVDASMAVAVEDSSTGAASAHRAGLRCVAVPTQYTVGNTFPDGTLILPSLAACSLAEVLARLQ